MTHKEESFFNRADHSNFIQENTQCIYVTETYRASVQVLCVTKQQFKTCKQQNIHSSISLFLTNATEDPATTGKIEHSCNWHSAIRQNALKSIKLSSNLI